MDANTVTPEPATTWYGNRRHYSTDLHDDEWNPGKGRRGTAVCSTASNPVDVNAQDWIDAMAGEYPHLAKITVADLPVCKKCVRKAGIPS
jgi:hypothetical protein